MNDVEIRKRILAAAESRFFKLGFGKVTMSDIASDLKMSKKTLYAYYTSKEQLLSAVVENLHAEMDVKINALIDDREMDFVEKLKKLMEHGAMFYSRFGQTFLADIQRNAPEIWKNCDEFRRERMRSNLVQFFRHGVRDGYFRDDINEQVVTLLHVTAMQALITPEVLSQLPLSAAQLFETITKVVFEGILTEDARKKNGTLEHQNIDKENYSHEV